MTQGIAIIGAGGFVGTSLVEALVLNGVPDARAIVRSFRSFAGLSRFGDGVALVRADAEDPAAILPALKGCATVINLTTGSSASILRSTKVIVQACQEAQVERLIHLSSAVVYGDIESASIADDSPPVTDHWMPYARAKAAAEIWLRENAMALPFQVIVLRPGIVWGVRSPHTLDIVKALVEKTTYLVDQGQGIFHSILIDNLIACLLACHRQPGKTAGFYNVADAEAITWRDFYAALGAPLGCDVARMPNVSGARFPWSTRALFEYVQSLPVVNGLYHRLKTRLPDGLRAQLKSYLASRNGYEQVGQTYIKRPSVSRELWHLQKTRHKLPQDKFNRRFAFTPPVSFAEGIRKTVQWLTFLGYARPGFESSSLQGDLP